MDQLELSQNLSSLPTTCAALGKLFLIPEPQLHYMWHVKSIYFVSLL